VITGFRNHSIGNRIDRRAATSPVIHTLVIGSASAKGSATTAKFGYYVDTGERKPTPLVLLALPSLL
jgi:hypothetical protein